MAHFYNSVHVPLTYFLATSNLHNLLNYGLAHLSNITSLIFINILPDIRGMSSVFTAEIRGSCSGRQTYSFAEGAFSKPHVFPLSDSGAPDLWAICQNTGI